MRKLTAVAAITCVLSVAAWWLGCAQTEPTLEPSTSVAPAAKGAFRGRWWSYYERGGQYLAAEQFADAESDFLQALEGRSTDAWSARTYGLHFTEFFPNRELGVTYYHLERLNDAETYLTKSLADVDTERAHYYLDLVKKAKLAKGNIQDTGDPGITVSIQDGAIIATRDLAVTVSAVDDVGVEEVRLNDKRLYQRGSRENLELEDDLLLTEGSHQIQIQATDLAGKAVTSDLTVSVDLTGPNIGIFEPVDGFVTEAESTVLRGTSMDANGVVSVALDERTLAQGDAQKKLDFETQIPLEQGENRFVIAARDVAGNETFTAISVFRGAPESPSAMLWRTQQLNPLNLMFAQAGSAAAASSAVRVNDVAIKLKSPRPDRPYRNNRTLRVAGEVSAPTPLARLSINGEVYEPLTGAPKESFNKRVPLDTAQLDAGGAIQIPVRIEAADAQGKSATETFNVTVEPVFLNKEETKMPVAVFEFDAAGVPVGAVTEINQKLQKGIGDSERFHLLEREELLAVVTEQQLSSIADPNTAIKVGKLVNAHVFLMGTVVSKAENELEIFVRAINTETSTQMARLDAFVSDSSDNNVIDEAVAGLVQQLLQKFPRLSGEVVGVRKDDFLVPWTKEDGAYEGEYLTVVYVEPYKDDSTGEVLDEILTPAARARIEEFLATNSRATLVGDEEMTIETGMPVVSM